MEKWRVIEDFPEFAISSDGRVQNIPKQRFINTRSNLQGFEMVTMYDDTGHQKTRSVAHLVASAYLEEPKNPNYNSIIHLNGDRLDCRSMNLMWRPRWYALQFHKMFEDMPYRVAVYIPFLDKVYHSLREACTTHGLVERSTYIDICNGQPCFHYGWIIEEIVE